MSSKVSLFIVKLPLFASVLSCSGGIVKKRMNFLLKGCNLEDIHSITLIQVNDNNNFIESLSNKFF